jgi:hypothetical protein
MKNYRYPGVNPFESEQEDRFFGRTSDISDLCDLIILEKVVVLFGKSGYGKSSLINAGVIPAIRKMPQISGSITPIRIRVGTFSGAEPSPLETIINRLNENFPLTKESEFIDSLIDTPNLWYHFKRRQSIDSSQKFLIIFDQFEEFFTFAIEDQIAFKNALSDVLFGGLPQNIRDVSENQPRSNRLILASEIDLHVLFVVREDRLSLMDNLRDRIPTILQKRYQLRALSSEQARDAIVKPALLSGVGYYSQQFNFTEEALTKIIDELSRKGPSQKVSIEAFQLQIVCQYVESDIVDGKIMNRDNKGVLEVRPENLPDLSNIYEAYYSHQISLLPSTMQEVAKKVIEEGLILEDPISGEGRRLSLDKDLLVHQYNLFGKMENLLTQLENTFLIRREVNSLGGFNYEISHDTLIAPILQVRREKREIELVKELERTKRASRVRNVVRGSIISFISMVLLVYNWEFLSAYAITIFRGQSNPIVKNDFKLNKCINEMSYQLEFDMRNQTKGGKYVLGSWTTSQVLTALNGKAENLPKENILDLYKVQMLDSCCCWSEIDNEMRDIRTTSWAIGGLYRIGWASSIECDLEEFLLSNQLENGAWSMIGMDRYDLSTENFSSFKFGSTYATCHALLGLNLIRQVNDDYEIQNAIDKGISWLKSNNDRVRWKDYPNNNEEAVITSKSISGLALHTLNVLGAASPEMNQLWLTNLDYSDLDNPLIYKEQSDVFYRFISADHLRTVHHDATRHFVLPWLIVATVDAYNDGTLEQKAKANLWLSKAVDKTDIIELRKSFPFTKAELLIAFRYLAENKIKL